MVASLLSSKIAGRVNKAQSYTVMMDGSTDRKWREMEGIVVRFNNDNGKIEEHAIGLLEAQDRSAKGLLKILTTYLADLGLSLDEIVSQCYDGASVMSGHRGGLQQLLSVTCERSIMYVHCFCHKFHPVVMDIIESIPPIVDHYSLIKSLYGCLKLEDVKERYQGLQLKRLLETSWSGHRDCAHAINSEIKEIINCLTVCSTSRDVKSEHRILVRGLLTRISKPSFILLNKFVTEFLDVINIANQVCQSKNSNLANVLNFTDECKSQVADLTNLYTAQKISHDLDVLDKQYWLHTRSVREKTQSKTLENFIIEAPIPAISKEENEELELPRIIVDLCDCFQKEMENRFAVANISLWSSMGALSPTHPHFCDSIFLQPFFEYMLTIPVTRKQLNGLHADDPTAFRSECKVFKNVIMRRFESTNADVGEVYLFLHENYTEAAPIFTALYKLCMTCGYASARVVCLFSALNYVHSPRRSKSNPLRENALIHLLYEKDMVREITFEEFTQVWLKKPRSLFF